MTQYVCDRCGTVKDRPLQVLTLPEDKSNKFYNAKNEARDIDLCGQCVTQVRDWAMPIPKEQAK